MVRLVCCVCGLILWGLSPVAAQSPVPAGGDPAEVICTVDEQPIYRGEFNLMLAEQLAGKSTDTASAAMRQAIALTLVRRHLAMRSLLELGGESFKAQLKQGTQQAAQQAERRGDSLDQVAERAGSDMRSLGRDLVWKIGWAQYLRSRLTEENLQRFFDANRAKYDGTKVRVSHLFVPLAAGDPEAVRQSMENLQALAARIAAADDVATEFAAAVREHSQSTSADNDGDLGWVGGQGDLPPAVSEAVMAAKVGQVVGPIRSPLGLHLLYVQQRRDGQLSREQMPDQAGLRRDAAAAMFTALVRRQRDADVQWLDESLTPPAEAAVIP
ncbi:peptidylprolyl isomerase [Roseimaritima ulvae]|uniref:Foldase protein PrsA n=1 Tax=Roseimaritima ulvae TaxID=980254 RepID=A0A5B9QXD9_9BACT|nr:peptidylprolyl isomerase [Roseimaritima ulvae]QEG43678.1 Foldase protein PrsA precursor [Roseimaritima ulvae]